MIAYHFQYGECYREAIRYYVQSIEQLALNNPSFEVIATANTIFEIDSKYNLLNTETKVKIRQLEAQTYLVQGRIVECKTALNFALVDLNYPLHSPSNENINYPELIRGTLNINESNFSKEETERLLNLGKIFFLMSEAAYFLADFNFMAHSIWRGLIAFYKVKSKVPGSTLLGLYANCICYLVIHKELELARHIKSLGDQLCESSGLSDEALGGYYQIIAFPYSLILSDYDSFRKFILKSKEYAVLDRDYRRIVRHSCSMGLIEQLSGNLKVACDFYQECMKKKLINIFVFFFLFLFFSSSFCLGSLLCDNINDVLYRYESRINCALCYYWRGFEFDTKISLIECELKEFTKKFPISRRSEHALNAFYLFRYVQSSMDEESIHWVNEKANSLLKTKPITPFSFVPFWWYLECLEWMISNSSPLLKNVDILRFFKNLASIYKPLTEIFSWTIPYFNLFQGKLLITTCGLEQEAINLWKESLGAAPEDKFMNARLKMEIGFHTSDPQLVYEAEQTFKSCESFRFLKEHKNFF